MYKNHEGYPDNVAGTAIENIELYVYLLDLRRYSG